MKNLAYKASQRTNYLWYGLAIFIFVILISARESERFGSVFEYLPVLGGSIPYFILTISFIFIYKHDGKSLKQLGWCRPHLSITKSVFFVLSSTLLILFLSLVVASVVMEVFDLITGSTKDLSERKNVLVGNLPLLLLLTPLMWLAVIAEELLFRGFIMNFIANQLGGGTKSWIIAIVVSSLVFGLAHFWQGARGIIGAGALALVWGAAYCLCKKNLWPAIIAHCALNTIGFVSTFNS